MNTSSNYNIVTRIQGTHTPIVSTMDGAQRLLGSATFSDFVLLCVSRNERSFKIGCCLRAVAGIAPLSTTTIKCFSFIVVVCCGSYR